MLAGNQGEARPPVQDRRPATGPVGPVTLTGLHLAIVVLCAFGFSVDLAELALGGALSSIFAAPPYHLDSARLTWLVTAPYAGALIGAPAFGWAADRIGPMKVLRIVICWIGVWSLASALVRDPGGLAGLRLLAGIGIGAFPPVMIAYLTDVAPARQRGTLVFTACGLAYLAPPAAIFAVRWLTPIAPLGIEGWRWPFAASGILALLVGAGMAWLPEAPHWLEAAGRADDVRRVVARFRGSRRFARFVGGAVQPDTPAAARLVHQPARPRITALLALCFISFTIPIATVSFPLLTGPMLLARHFSLSDTLFYVGIATFGPIFGTLAGGAVVDRMGRRLVMALCAGGMLGSVWLFFVATQDVAIGTALIGFALFTSLYMPAMTLYGAELFPAATRARNTSIAWLANRAAAAGAPAVLVPLVHARQTVAIAIVLAAALAANLLAIGLVAPAIAPPRSPRR